ncbi:MAG: GNAT family N-acetyltransferase [bacterium]|nr:GNAT family N-acetyltransferase [bacterium]
MKITKDRMNGICEIMFNRIILRRFEEGDEEDVFEYGSDPNVLKYLSWSGLSDKSEVHTFMERYIACNPWVFAIVHKEANKCIGTVEVRRSQSKTGICLGYLLNRKYWGMGIMTEVVTGLVRYCFEVLKVDYVEATHFAGNFASGRVLTKAGLEVDVRVHQKIKVQDRFFEVIYYSLSKEKYDKKKR